MQTNLFKYISGVIPVLVLAVAIGGCGSSGLGDTEMHNDSSTPTDIVVSSTDSPVMPNVYKVGDIGPGGGVVFYVSQTPFTSRGSDCANSCLYLEVAPTEFPSSEWCKDRNIFIRFTSVEIGSGMNNTTRARGACISGAIQIASDYVNGGKNDWFLPSKDELNELYLSRALAGVSKMHWSSSEFEGDESVWAWAQYFHDGSQHPNKDKADALGVRPIRAF
jgi:hypothetical protein